MEGQADGTAGGLREPEPDEEEVEASEPDAEEDEIEVAVNELEPDVTATPEKPKDTGPSTEACDKW